MAEKGFRISDLPLNRIPNFLSPKNSLKRNQNFSPNNLREKKNIFLSDIKAVTKSEVKIIVKDSGVN